MESGEIPGKQITASSVKKSNHAAQGRLRFKATSSKVGAWVSATDNKEQWLQVDLGTQYTRIVKVATQGRNSNGNAYQWVKEFQLQYSHDGANFTYYMDPGKTTAKVHKNSFH